MKTLTINGVAKLIKLGEEHGLTVHSLLEQSGISEAMLTDPYASIRPNQEFQVIRNLMRRLDTEDLGLIVGKQFSLSVLGILGATVPNTQTIREAIRFFNRYINLSYTYFHVRFEEHRDHGRIILKDKIDLGDLRKFFIDRDTMFTLNALHDLFPQLPYHEKISIELGYEEPVSTTHYRSYLKCPVKFIEGDTHIKIDNSILDCKLPQYDELTLKLLEQQCISIDNKITGEASVVDKVSTMLLENISRNISLEDIALTLGLSARTIRRHLKEEGSQFKALQSTIKSNEAKRLLRETSWPIEKISDQLGYSEPAAFIHAFKNWVQQSPSSYRKSLNKFDSSTQ